MPPKPSCVRRHYAASLLPLGRTAVAAAAQQDRHSRRIETSAWHLSRCHGLSQTKTAGLPHQLLSSRPLLHAPRNRPLRRQGTVVAGRRMVLSDGTLLATAETFVNRSPRGCFADELARALHVEVQDALHQLTQQRRITRQLVSGLYLYTAIDRTVQQGQLLTRRNLEAVPTMLDASKLEVSEEELKAAILLFYSLLDEQQRRLYAGLESLKLGRGGDRRLAGFLDLDPHTVARGRQQLLAQDVEVSRARGAGGGRKPVEKKLQK